MTLSLQVALTWLALAASPAAQEAPPGSARPVDAMKARMLSGRVLDRLGRPVPGVRVIVLSGDKKTVLQTGDDGRYSGTLPTYKGASVISFEKEGYGGFITDAESNATVTIRHKVDWDEASGLPYLDGNELDQGVRGLLASEEWALHDGELLGFLFRHQEEFRPALRRLVRDTLVGAGARDWLDLLDDPDDRDLFAKGRQYAPKKEVKEIDLIETLKATARLRHFFSTAPEPMIDIDCIAFTKDLDRVLIQCGINRVAMTGITWQFVFRRAGKQWELRSAKEVGRS